MAKKHPEIRVGDIVVTEATLKAMLVKSEEKEKKGSKETLRGKRSWAVRVTDSEKVALAAVLAAMRTNN